ncbi:MAG: hypothetical protein ACHP7P_04190 [Terriglobales bacterium]
MGKEQWRVHVLRRRKVFVRLGALVPLCLIALAAVAEKEVKTGFLFAIPAPVGSYMLETGPQSFSAQHLKALVPNSSGTLKLYPILLGIYWGYFAALALAASIAPIWLLVMFRPGAVVTVLELDKALARFENRRTLSSRWGLVQAIGDASSLYASISPLKEDWFRSPRFKWLRWSALPKEERATLGALRHFMSAMKTHFMHGSDMHSFSKPLSILVEFFWSVAAKENTRWLAGGESTRPEVDILHDFSRAARPLIIQAKTLSRPREHLPRLRAFVGRLVQSQLVRYSLSLSVAAAVMMVFGVLAFRISPSQGFLTWFTVTFGSLTISVGVTAVSLRHGEKERTDDEGKSRSASTGK